jgi:putative hydrolase of the HAD superfamily
MAHPGLRRSTPIWLFDLDNTLHDASLAVFGELRESMSAYIEQELRVDREQANLLRHRYWLRYGATLLGLMHHHGVSADHFLHHTHLLPGLEDRVRSPLCDRSALRRLPGQRWILTNAPRAYAWRVIKSLNLHLLFDGVICIEDMRMFGHLRPKPDARMLLRVCVRLRAKPTDCVLVEDTLEHQRAARRVGMRTVWMQRFLRPGLSQTRGATQRLHRRPAYVDRRISRLRDL